MSGNAEEILRKAGILFPLSLSLPICVQCDTAIRNNRSSFADHMRKKPHFMSSANYQALWACVLKLSNICSVPGDLRAQYLEDKIPRSSRKPLPELPGLQVHRVFQCPYCYFFVDDLKKLANHIRQTGHCGQTRISVGDLKHITPQNGQAVWKKKGSRLFFPVARKLQIVERPSSFAGRIIESLKKVSNGSHFVWDLGERREMCAFVEATRGDIRLKQLSVKWDDAVMLCGGPLVRGCKLQTELKNNVKRALMAFFLYAKASCRGEVMSGTEVMSAVAAPGAVEKSKVFSFKTETTEEKYAGRCARLFLMAIRVHRLAQENDPLIGLVEMSDELKEAVRKLEGSLWNSNKSDTYPGCKEQGSVLRTATSIEKPGSPKAGNQEVDGSPVSRQVDESMKELTKLVNDVLRLILHEKSSILDGARNTFASSFISCLLVTRSGSSSPRLCEGREISPTLAALAYAAGCCGILSIRKWPVSLSSETELERIKQMHSPGGRYGINILQEMAAKTRLTRNAESSRALWAECREAGHRNCGYIGGVHLSAKKVGDVVTRMQKELHEALLGKTGILSGVEVPVGLLEKLDHMTDDEVNKDVGYCFADHPRNQGIVSEMSELVEGAIHTLSSKDDDAVLRHSNTLLEKIERASFVLIALLHLTGGSPGRGTEAGFQSVRNTGKGPREYFILGRRLASIPGYAKTRSMCGGKMRMISRHPDKLTGNLFKAFVLLAMPMRAAITVSRLSDEAAEREVANAASYYFVIADPKHRACAIEKMATCWKDHGLNMGGRNYRQWYGGYANDKANHVPESCLLSGLAIDEEKEEQAEDEEYNIGHVMQIQGGHSVRTARSHYGRSMRGLSYDGSLDPRKIQQMLAASDEWLGDIGLLPEMTWKRETLAAQKLCESRIASEETDPIDEFDSFVTNFEPSPDKGVDKEVHEVAESIEEYEGFSNKLDTYPDQLKAEVTWRTKADQETTIRNRHFLQYPFIDKFDDIKALRLAVGDGNAMFRTKLQKEAMEVVAKGCDDLLICDRTGGGKSAVIFGPALLESGVTVYVCPLISLQEDLKSRSEACGLKVTVFKEVMYRRETIPSAGLLLVSPEFVGIEEYNQVIRQLWVARRLCRIVIDELHVVLVSEHYRPCMTRMWQVRPEGVEAQLVMMTATAPPKMVRDMLRTVGCDEDAVRVMRGTSLRDNIGVHVKLLERGDRIALVHHIVEETVSGVLKAGRAASKHLVAALTRGDVDEIHAALLADQRLDRSCVEVRKYHSGMTLEDRLHCAKSWRDSKNVFVMVATDGFGVGIDAPDVRHVIVAGCSRSLIDFWQVVGRIGRDGKRGVATVLYHKSHVWRAGVEDPKSKLLLKDFVDWAENDVKCRIREIDTYFGTGSNLDECWMRKGSDGGPVEICNVCAFQIGTALFAEPTAERLYEKKSSLKRVVRGELAIQPKRKKTNLMSRSDIRNEIAVLRARARRIAIHCPACVIETGKCGIASTSLVNSRKHGVTCFANKCLRCMGCGHDARDCDNIIKPSRENGVRGCKACYIWTVRGMPIHEGSGPAQNGLNEFGSTERCPFKNITSIAMATWHDVGRRRKLVEALRIEHLTAELTAREFANWLLRDNSSSGPGILSFAEYAMHEYKF